MGGQRQQKGTTGRGAEAPAPDASGDPYHRADPPILSLTLRPHQSLTPRAAGWCLGIAAAGLTLPLLPLLGSAAGWGLLPFLLAALLGLDWALRRSHADGRLREDFRLWPDLVTVVRREARGGVERRWHANPFWIEVRLHRDAALENYLTLRGNGREIELGAFLSPEERADLHRQIIAALARLRAGGTPAESC